MLCFRCEHRAKYLEEYDKMALEVRVAMAKGESIKERHISRPRNQCGGSKSNDACYMYKPVKPVLVEPLNPEDIRPIFGASIFAGRVKVVGVADVELKYAEVGKSSMVYWVPK